MAPQELDKVLSIESFAEVTKRNGDDNELNSLKIMPLNGMKEKKRTIHWASWRALEGVSQLKRNPSQNYAGCTFKFLLQRQWKVSASTTEERMAFHHWFRRRELNFYIWSRLFWLFSFGLQNCLFLCHARMSFRHVTSFCILNGRKGVSGSAFFSFFFLRNRLLELWPTIHQKSKI